MTVNIQLNAAVFFVLYAQNTEHFKQILVHGQQILKNDYGDGHISMVLNNFQKDNLCYRQKQNEWIIQPGTTCSQKGIISILEAKVSWPLNNGKFSYPECQYNIQEENNHLATKLCTLSPPPHLNARSNVFFYYAQLCLKNILLRNLNISP